MSEREEAAAAGSEGNATAADPAAIALSLSGASREKADAFLDDQRAFIADHRHHLHEQLDQIHLDVWEKKLGVLLRLATLLVGVAVACFAAAAVWTAAHDDGLVIEAFSVPAEFSTRGLTGQVVASELLGKLARFQIQTNSVRAASSYTNNWGDDIKIEIPETGVSIGEFNRFLTNWLGHQTHISGAVYRTTGGIAVTARIGLETVPTITGGDAELEQILQKTAEAIYKTTQPYRFAQYTFAARGFKDAETAQKALVADGTPQDRFWAYNGLITMYASQLDAANAEKAARSAMAMRPDSGMPAFNLARSEMVAQHDEAALAAAETALRQKRDPDITEQSWNTLRPWAQCLAARLHGDFQAATGFCRQPETLPDIANTRLQSRLLRISILAQTHDAQALHDAFAALPPTDDPASLSARAGYLALNDLQLGHGSALLADRALFENSLTKLPYGFFFNTRNFRPGIAYALALAGDFARAQAEIDRTPIDCDVCLRTRGRIAALEKNWAQADSWFSRAAQQAPSTPFAFTDWGRMLLDKGDADGAIVKFQTANEKAPHFADAMEGWGEALMAKNQSHLAPVKFAAAEKSAPNWGRLHLKWGEALAYAGNREAAKAQFARAAQLDLTPSEKTELTRQP